MNKKLLLIPLLLITTIAIASATVVNYDFDSCTNLTDCNLSEIGYNAGLGLSYITTLGSDSVLYFNGARHTSSPYEPYVLQFDIVPEKATYVEFMVRPADSNYAEFGLHFLSNETSFGLPDAKISVGNTDYSDKVNMAYDFDGSENNANCDKFPVGVWSKVTLIMDEGQNLSYYLNDVLSCSLNWSIQSYNSINLGSFINLRTTTGDTSPNIYLDNFTFSNETGSLALPIEPIFEPLNTTNYTYDFENSCAIDDLDCNGLREVGYNKGYNQSYIADFDGSRVLYYNGRRGGSTPYSYRLQFLNVPKNTTTIEYSIYPIDGSYAEMGFLKANNTYLQFTPTTAINTYNTDYSNYVRLQIGDYDSTLSTTSCTQYTVGTWNQIKLEIDYAEKILEYYKDNLTSPDCIINFSTHPEYLDTLGDIMLLTTTSSDDPNVYLDNITFSQTEGEEPENHAPNITDTEPAAASVTINETDNLTMSVTASDPENDTLNYTWTVEGSPAGTDSDTYIFEGSIGEGTYEVFVSVTDGEYTDNHTWTVTVENQPPVINTRSPTDTDQHIYQDGGMTFTLNATDPEGGVLFYSWELDGNPLYLEVYPMWSFIAPDRGMGYFNITAFVEDENSNIVQTTWLLNVTAGYTADYTGDDLAPVVISGLVKVIIAIIAFAGIIALMLVYLEGRNRITGKRK